MQSSIGEDLTTATIARTIAVSAATAADRFGDRPAVRYRAGDDWEERSFREVCEIVDEIALGLAELGLGVGDRACILANTRVEWTYASLAISTAGGVVVPIYPTNSPQECEWVAGNSSARLVFCEGAEQVAKIDAVRAKLPDLETVVVMEGTADGAITLDELRERGRGGGRDELERRGESVEPDDPCTIIYTSGTTGPPKGVVLTHANCSSVGAMVQELGFVTEDDVSYLYLPLAHVFALTVQLASFDVGTKIIYFGGDTRQIIPELQSVAPTYFPSVPRIFEKIYALATAALENAPPEEREKFERAIEVGLDVRERRRRGEDVPDELERAFEEGEERLYRNVRSLFGGNLREAVTGAAPISADILRFFYACGVLVLEGWGMTETTAVGCVGTRDEFRFGTVGKPVPGVEIRIADDDEVLIRGPNVFSEYWRNPEATRETFTDEGFLMTGDLGRLDDDGYLTITGRKKDIIITAGGKNLTPANLENDLKQSRWISQAVMYGDRKPYPVALITLDPEEILPWAREQGLPEDLGKLAGEPRVQEMIQAELDRANEHYARVEQIKRFAILDHDLSQETGELTPTLKVKRNVIYDRYGDVLEGLYG